MRKVARARQRILAAFLPIAAVLYISTDQVVTDMATGLKLLAITGRHPAQLYVAGTLSLLALGAVAVSYVAICLLVTGDRVQLQRRPAKRLIVIAWMLPWGSR